jgi:hypothetical protein
MARIGKPPAGKKIEAHRLVTPRETRGGPSVLPGGPWRSSISR